MFAACILRAAVKPTARQDSQTGQLLRGGKCNPFASPRSHMRDASGTQELSDADVVISQRVCIDNSPAGYKTLTEHELL